MDFIETGSLRMPALGLGTWELQRDTARKGVASALSLGYRHIDTAEMYGNEDDVGTGIKDSGIPRADIFLTTKVWADNLADGDLQKHAEASLKKLKTDYVDLLLIHWPNPAIPLDESIKALNEVKQSGKARHIGVSNFPVALMRECVETLNAGIVCNQVEYHPYLTQKPVLDYAAAHGLVVTAYSPLARGKIATVPLIKNLAEKYNKTPGQITLRWLTQQKNVAAIPKAASEKHQRDNLEIFDFKLTPEDMSAISALGRPFGRMVNPSFAPEWDEAA